MNKRIKHLLAFVMVVILVITAIPISISTNAKAATNGHTQADAVAWAISQTNNPRDYDGVKGVQCVDLIRMYYVYLGYYQVQGSGCDYATNTIPCSTWKRLSYYSGFIPQPGDVAVWTYASSSSGHVAIVTNADSSGFSVAEFLGSTHTGRTHRYSYSYGTLACFIRPDFNTVIDTTAPTISKTSVSCKTDSQFNINAELYDANGIDHVWLVVYGPGGEKQFSVNATNGSFYYTIYASEYGGQGVYTVHLYAFDYSGNSAKYVYENIKIMKDTTAPQITETFVSCISANSFNINATIYDEEGIDHAWLVIYGPGGEYQYSASASNGFFYYTIFTSNHGGPGNYTVHLYILDKSGNSSKAVYENIMATNAYTVSYNVNGGTGSIASQTKTHDTNLTLTTTKPTGKSFTVTYNANGGTVSTSSKTVSQTFTNWNTAANGSGTAYNAGTTYSVNASVTLYAQYANPSIGSLPTPTRSGYNFDGWYTAANGGIKITETTTVTTDITLYAHWITNTYTVTYNTNGGSGTISTQTFLRGSTTNLSSEEPIGKLFIIKYDANGGNVSKLTESVSQSFVNWNTKPDGSGSSYEVGEAFTANQNTILYAQYANPILGLIPTPTRIGYVFDGWYTELDGGKKVSGYTEISENLILFAHWTKKSTDRLTVNNVKIEDAILLDYKSDYNIIPKIDADLGSEYTITYESYDESIAKVDGTGKVHGIKKGNTVVVCTVTDSYGNVVKDSCNVNVDYSGAQWFIIIVLFGWIWYI